MTPPPPTTARSPLRRDVWAALVVLLVAGAVRVPRLNQSLWMDEMTTVLGYVLQPWHRVLAAGSGEYVPNNHVLHTVLVKLLYTALTGGRAALAAGRPPVESVLRLPAWAAGTVLPLAVAWPLRRGAPLAALAVAAVATVNPWLIDLSAEARGYTLMLLLGVLATHLLPRPAARGPAGYAVAVAAAVYTVPLAVMLVPGHAVAVWATRRPAARSWAVGVAAAGVLSVALYLPMAGGLIAYYRHPYPTGTYRRFLDALPRYVLTGERTPRQRVDPALPAPLDHAADPPGSALYWALPVLATILGTALGWPRFPAARPLLATLGTATVLGLLLPLVVRSTSEVRFDAWAVLWFCLAVGLLLAAIADVRTPAGWAAPGRGVAAAAAAVLVGLSLTWATRLLPNQPVREAMALADRLAPPGGPIVVAYVGHLETAALYAADAPDHVVLPAYDADDLARAQAEGRAENGRLPYVVVLFETMARDADPADRGTAGLWRELSTRYRVVARLDGRLAPVAIYAPLDQPTTAPPVTARR